MLCLRSISARLSVVGCWSKVHLEEAQSLLEHAPPRVLVKSLDAVYHFLCRFVDFPFLNNCVFFAHKGYFLIHRILYCIYATTRCNTCIGLNPSSSFAASILKSRGHQKSEPLAQHCNLDCQEIWEVSSKSPKKWCPRQDLNLYPVKD